MRAWLRARAPRAQAALVGGTAATLSLCPHISGAATECPLTAHHYYSAKQFPEFQPGAAGDRVRAMPPAGGEGTWTTVPSRATKRRPFL